MLVAMVIDATDGTLARWVRIKEAVPGFDGRRLDDLVDFSSTRVCHSCSSSGPDCCRWKALVRSGARASAYGFSQVEAKAADGSFRGFPSYWNVIAFYLYALPLTGWWAFAVILGFALLTFVPSRYPYPTQPGRVNRWLLLLSVPWAALVLVGLLTPWDDGVPRGVIAASAVYPVLYLGVAWGMSMRRRRAERRKPPG